MKALLLSLLLLFFQGSQHPMHPMHPSAPGAGLTKEWTPASLPNLYAWYRGDGPLWQDAARTTAASSNNDPVGAWDDKSGNGRHVTQPTADNRPLLIAAELNGKDVIRGDGTNDSLLLAGLSQAQPYTIYVVGARKDTGWNPLLCGGGVNQISENVEFMIQRSASGSRLDLRSPTSVLGTTALAVGTFYSLVGVYNGASSKGYVNGTEENSGDFGSNPIISINPFTHNRGHAGQEWGNVDVAEIVIQASAATAADRTNWAAYVATRYGL